MQRYHATVSNTAIGAPVRDTSRSDTPLLTANFPVNQRRPPQPVSYKLKCDKEVLNSRHGPPDFNPQTPNCPEETITREYLQSGYREAVEGLEENREISLTQIHAFSKPVVLKCKEAIRKCHRAINESRAQKRKAGQVYGVPLSGSLLSKPGIFPDQRACGEEFRKKWIEGLSQPHKRLRLLADHIPHGFRKRSLFEVLIRSNVPLQRATWFIKVSYLNQVRPVCSSSSGLPDRTLVTRSEQWTKDVIEYLQFLLDDISRSSHSGAPVRDRSSHLSYSGKLQQKNEPVSAMLDGEEPSLHFKWWYMVRIIQWHFAEGMLIPSFIIDWVLNQLQEKELFGTLQLVLPILYGVLEILVLSQTYVRTLVGLAVRFIQEPSSGGSDLVDNSRRAYAASSLVEMLRYMILAVPDSFVGLDCFPLPLSVVSHLVNDGNFLLKVDSAGKSNGVSVGSLSKDKGITAQCLSIDRVVASIKKRTDNLAMAARPGYPGRNAARTVLELDTSVTQGDLKMAFSCLFGELNAGVADEGWTAEVSPCLRSSLKWMGTVSSSFVASVFFLCEWATCDFRDFRTSLPRGQKFSGRKDFCQIYVAVRLLKLKLRELQNCYKLKSSNDPRGKNVSKGSGSSRSFKGYDSRRRKNPRTLHGRCMHLSDMLESPGELHDIIVCWIDQHDNQNEEGTKRLQFLIIELTRAGIFYPQAYVRQLIVSGIFSANVDIDKQSKHYKILKHLPTSYVQDALDEAQVADNSVLLKSMKVYTNERRLVLKGLFSRHHDGQVTNGLPLKQNSCSTSRGDDVHISSSDQRITIQSTFKSSRKKSRRVADLEGIKASISLLLQFPNSFPALTEVGSDLLQSSVQTTLVLDSCKADLGEGTPGCEECRRVKRQNLSDEKNSYLPGHSPNQSDDEEFWWVRKGTKALESTKIDQPLKPAKQTSKGRQKFVRKKSLAQLAAGRIEGGFGASTSHVCDSRVNCSHHTTGSDGVACKTMEMVRTSNCADIVSIGKTLKKLRPVDKKVIIVWLLSLVRKLIEESEEVVGKVGQFSRTAVDENSSVQWKLGEDELTTILYIMDISEDLVSAVRFLLWLLPKVLSTPNSSIYGGRSILMLPRNAGNHICDVGEAYLVSSIRRYENTVIAADLIADTLSATMRRVAVVVSTNGKTSGSASLAYARYLLKKYSNITSVVEWEKSFKASGDKRLIPELEFGRSSDAEFGFPLGVPTGVEDLDDFLRQKISGARVSRLGISMRDSVQRHIEDALQFYGRDKKLFTGGTMKGPFPEKFDDGYRVAQQVVTGLMDCIRQTGGAAQEGDPSLVSSAISAIINSIGTVVGKLTDLTGVSHPNFSSSNASLNFVRQLLQIHISCLCLLKEALGERQSRVFEIALAMEASSVLAQAFAPGKLSRGQYQLSPDAHDSNTSEILSGSTKTILGKAGKVSAVVSSLVLGAILQGVASLERMVSVFRLKEGLDVIQYVRGPRSSSNGNARSTVALKTDNIAEACVHWFRVLLGNCRAVCDGLVVELLGEPSIIALSRMQRTLPLTLVFPPAYSLFAFVIWRPFIFNAGNMNREDSHQLFQSATLAISDAINHLPFRDICMRDTRGLYDLMVADVADSEFAAILEVNNPDIRSKAGAFVPLRGRLFLNSIIDCKLPKSVLTRDDGNRGGSVIRNAEDESKILDKLVHILDTLQPAKFHWQWVELRLLLNEQALTEKLESQDTSLPDAIRSIYRNSDKENESNFVEIILTRLLVRPDAAPLFSEVVRLFGSSLEDSVLLQVKWFLGGQDVLFGRKSIRQRLNNIAESKGFSTKPQYRKPWGWFEPRTSVVKNKGKKRKFEGSVLEEGEVVDEGIDIRTVGNSSPLPDVDNFNACQQLVTERSLVELVLPCIDHSSEESRSTFASDLIKQLNTIELQISAITRGASKQSGTVILGTEGSGSKSNNRKSIRSSSPGLARRATPSSDIAIPSPSALRASMSLRLQFLLRLLPIICSDREPSVRSLRIMLVSVILRLLGSRVVHEDANHSCYPIPAAKRELELSLEASAAYIVDLSGECLFDRLLLVLHGLLSSSFPSWLKPKPGVKLAIESGKDTVFDREVAETLQNDLDRMILPDRIRWRIQSAMPVLDPSFRFAISCQPPFVPSSALAALQPSILVSGLNLPQRNSASLGGRAAPNLSGKNKSSSLTPQPDQEMQEMEIDPWTLLEDGAGSGPSSGNTAAIANSDNADLKASSWLKGSVRIRRTDLTYIGPVDDDS